MTHPQPPATLAPATQVSPLAQQPAAYPPSTPLLEKKKSKSDLLFKKKNVEDGRERNGGSGTTAQPTQSSPTCFTLSCVGSGTTARPTFVWYCVSLSLLSHRLRVVVSPVPAACPVWPLDTRLSSTLRECLDWPAYKGKVLQPTYAAPLPY